MCTQSGGLRPFGVVLLLAGVDQTGATLYKTDPTGIYNQYKATAIGEGEDEAKEILRDEYDPSMTIDEGLELSVKILKETLSEKLEPKRIDTAYVTTEEERMEKFSEDKIKEVLDEV
jgi:proteasome alpha subunit